MCKPKPPFNPAGWAMLLLGVLVVIQAILILLGAYHCLIIGNDPQCRDKNWAQMIKDWLTETYPVLIALILVRSRQE